MADASFPLVLATPVEGVRKLRCDCLTVTLADGGEAAFLKGHAPFLGLLPPGTIRLRSGDTEDRYETEQVLLQVSSSGVSLLSGRFTKLN